MVKRFIFLLLHCFFFSGAFAQTYPLPQPSAKWGEFFFDLSSSQRTNQYRQYIGDTVMCNNTYAMYETPGTPNSHDQNYTRYSNGQVYWLVASCTNTEVLLYDFNLVAGDTMITYHADTLIVNSVSYVTMNNGQSRKQIMLNHLQPPSSPVIWVDGIGDVYNGFFYPEYIDGVQYTACHKDSSGTVLDHNNPYYDCDSMELTVLTGTVAVQNTSGWCYCDGSISLASVSGGSAPYSMQAGSLSGGTFIANLCPGVYNVTVYSSEGLFFDTTIAIPNNPPPNSVQFISQSGDTLTAYPGFTYQWYYNSSIIPNATQQTYVATQNGDYYAMLTDSAGCYFFTNLLNVTVTSVIELEKKSLLVYPNPGNGIFIIEDEFAGGNFGVYNILGDCIHTASPRPAGAGKVELDLSHLETGTYYLKFLHGNTLKPARIVIIR